MQLVASGYEAVRVAYRGSSGYGEHLKTANTGCYGVSDVNDVIHAGVWWQHSFGRGRPLALFGNSYGGYLSLMALARRDSPFCGAEDDTHSLARHRPEVRRRSERFLAQLAMH